MWSRKKEKCPHYRYVSDGENFCAAPGKSNAPVNGSRLPDCDYPEYTDDHCFTERTNLTDVIHLVPITETIYASPRVRVFKHEVSGKL